MSAKPPGKLKWQIILFLARRLPDCKQMTQTLSASVDRDLTFREKIVSKLHLFTCEACQLYVEQIRFLHDAMQSDRVMGAALESFSPSLSSEAKERIKNALAPHR